MTCFIQGPPKPRVQGLHVCFLICQGQLESRVQGLHVCFLFCEGQLKPLMLSFASWLCRCQQEIATVDQTSWETSWARSYFCCNKGLVLIVEVRTPPIEVRIPIALSYLGKEEWSKDSRLESAGWLDLAQHNKSTHFSSYMTGLVLLLRVEIAECRQGQKRAGKRGSMLCSTRKVLRDQNPASFPKAASTKNAFRIYMMYDVVLFML